MSSTRPPHAPSIRFDGSWTEEERVRIEEALRRANSNMTNTQKERLRGRWIAQASRKRDTPYYVLHRRGMGQAFTGHSVKEVVRQVRQRWPPDGE